jgi:hypothetical protein
MGWARNLSLISRVMTVRAQEDVGAKRRLGPLREIGKVAGRGSALSDGPRGAASGGTSEP